MHKEKLKEILELHRLWTVGDPKGQRADLSGANLLGAKLSKANLQGANLYRANLLGADLQGANLSAANLLAADLSGANLSGANLLAANLKGANLLEANLLAANLQGADLSAANLSEVSLYKANLSNVIVDNFTQGYYIACPESGEFTAYKSSGDIIIKLLIPADAKRCSATTRKCRCDKAVVLEISGGLDSVASTFDSNFVYKVGETVTVDNFENDRWKECAAGIHFFMTKLEAELW